MIPDHIVLTGKQILPTVKVKERHAYPGLCSYTYNMTTSLIYIVYLLPSPPKNLQLSEKLGLTKKRPSKID